MHEMWWIQGKGGWQRLDINFKIFLSSNESFDLKLFWNFFIISLNCYLILFSNIFVEKNREREREKSENGKI